MEAPIGVIDSGVGGLTVVKELLNRLPHEPIVYIGDDARCPYGPRSAEEVIQFTVEMASALSRMDIKMLVVACNTATAVALDILKETFSFPIIGVIEPGARAALQASATGEIVVLGTVGTVKSGAYSQAIRLLSPRTSVFQLACPEFVPIVESGRYKTEEISGTIQQTLQPLRNLKFDTAILGCTHYPLLHDHIKAQLRSDVKIVSSAIETVHDVEKTLLSNRLASHLDHSATPVFYTTGEVHEFQNIVTDWLDISEPIVKQIKL
ncbi:glutamate racemase [Sporosarcina luteola]|nr:glutamate racemase [Sporosarcina luteola]